TVNGGAKLLEDGPTAISGRSVTFSAGNATATGMTDANGVASSSLPLGFIVFSVGASFAGDNDCQPATASPLAVPLATALSAVAASGGYNDASTATTILTDVSVSPTSPPARTTPARAAGGPSL
ncbi:MAG TPA: hypothetical protein VGP33_08240, partial [Chloroflexota bacterium]|nr:hypothetical protein [Chloroflexota bacterium]